MEQQIGSSRNCIGLIVAMIAMSMSFATAQQKDCYSGVFSDKLEINGTIEICPQFASQFPALQRQLKEVLKSQGNQQDQTKELLRLIRDMNSVSKNIGQKRQAELLKSFSAQLSAGLAAGQQQTQRQIADLADRMDELKDLLLEKLGNRDTADRANAAVDGPVGDAIARLDLTKAHDLLEDIRAQLNAIGSEVSSVHADTSDIKKTIEQESADAAQRRKEDEERQRAAEERTRKAQEDKDNDPEMFTRAQIVELSHFNFIVAFSSAPPLYPPFLDPTFRIALRKGEKRAWVINVVNRQVAGQGEYWKFNTDELGDKAVFCFASKDKKTGKRRQWTQRYTVRQVGHETNFIPEGEPKFLPAEESSCDGVTDVRQPAAEKPAAAPMSSEQSVQDQLANIQQQRVRAMASPAAFGRIDIRAKKSGMINNSGWLVIVFTSPSHLSTTLYDVQVQMVMKEPGNKAWPVQLSNREITGSIEKRSALLKNLGTEAVVCFTARDPNRSQPLRMTKWFSIEASRGPGPNGYSAAFVPSREPTLAPASEAPCE